MRLVVSSATISKRGMTVPETQPLLQTFTEPEVHLGMKLEVYSEIDDEKR